MKKRTRANIFSYTMAIKKTTPTEVTPEETPVEETTVEETPVVDGFLPEEPTPEVIVEPTIDVTPVLPPSLDVAPAVLRGADPVVAVQNSTVAASTQHQLTNGEFVSRYYPLFETEEPGVKACVTINGVPYWFEKGKEVRIPIAVAAVYDITVERKMLGSQRARAKLATRPDFVNAFN